MSAEDAPPRIDVRRGNPSEEELAAVMAVVGTAYVEEAAATVAAEQTRSAWSVSQRTVRGPLRREFGWRGFRG